MSSLDDVLASLEALDQRKTFNKWLDFKPVPKQAEFLALGAQYPERLLMAGNRLGKTECAAYEISRHMTGLYPPWWKGKRFTRPVRVWGAGTSNDEVRNAIQEKLMGPVGNPAMMGSGYIPKDAIIGTPRASRSSSDAYDSWQVKHVSGGVSRMEVKTYTQERQHWQGAEIDIIWFDEEPPLDKYTEGRTRLGGKGISLMTFTPLLGMSDVVQRFIDETDPYRVWLRYGISDCDFKSGEEKRQLLAAFPPHEREARANGVPLLGSGKVFSTPIQDLLEPSLHFTVIPDSWPRIWGIDFGIGHPFAAVLIAWDRDNDIVHLLREYRVEGAIPLQHAETIKRMAANVPIAWPHDGTHREASSGEPLANEYRKFGLKMIDEHATFDGGGYSFETGVLMLENRMTTGRLKVDQGMTLWQQEYGYYHRKDGLVVKLRDDLLSATRIGVMMLRRARCVPFGSRLVKPLRQQRRGDINPWTGRPTGAPYGNSRNHQP